MISGLTNSKLSQISGYNLKNPFRVGVNGVSNIIDVVGDNDEIVRTIKYNIDGILYETTFIIDNNDSTENNTSVIIKNKQNYSVENNENTTTTIFKTNLSGVDFIEKPSIKEENKFNQIFQPEIKADIFIERTNTNVFERHSRLEDIKTIGQLENYKNRFFNIIKGE
jgi:hypothetical protein